MPSTHGRGCGREKACLVVVDLRDYVAIQFAYRHPAAVLLLAEKSSGYHHGVPRADGDAMLVGRNAVIKPIEIRR